MDKETYSFMYPTRIASFSFRFSDHAMQWLCGTTTDDNSRETGNFTLFGEDGINRRCSKWLPQTAHAFRRSGAVFRGTAFFAMEHGQEAHTQPACHAYGDGAYRHLPFKSCIRDDLSVPNRVENSGRRYYIKPFYPRTEGRIRAVRSRADNGTVQKYAFRCSILRHSTGTILFWLWQTDWCIGMER